MDLAERPQSDLDGDLFDTGGAQLSDHNAERQVLGFLLNKPGAIAETIDILKPADLHDPFHRRMYELLLQAYETDEPPTMATLISGLGGEKSAGAYIARVMAEADLSDDVAETADHLQIVSERRAVGTADDIDFNRGKPFVSRFGAQRWEDIGTAGAASCYAWLVEDVIPLNEISMAFGDSGTGKSFDMFDMAMCIARGIKFNGHNVERGLVLYVAAEAGKGFAKRKIAYAIQHQLEPSEPLPFVLLTKRPNFFQDDADVLALIEEIVAIGRSYDVPLVLRYPARISRSSANASCCYRRSSTPPSWSFITSRRTAARRAAMARSRRTSKPPSSSKPSATGAPISARPSIAPRSASSARAKPASPGNSRCR